VTYHIGGEGHRGEHAIRIVEYLANAKSRCRNLVIVQQAAAQDVSAKGHHSNLTGTDNFAYQLAVIPLLHDVRPSSTIRQYPSKMLVVIDWQVDLETDVV
jgi:hypothetical protein